MISEEDARALIEEHMRKQGWDVTDFTILRRAVSVDEGEADYVIYHDGAPAAIIEAKKPGKDLDAALEQAKGYARKIKAFLIYSSDGYDWLFQNLRARTLPQPIPSFPTPAEFEIFFESKSPRLLGDLRPYQQASVSQVIASIRAGRRRMYLQMATASGKTITAAGIIAKLFDLGRIRKVLFLVDRDALATQTVEKFRTHLGDYWRVERAEGQSPAVHADIVVSTIQFLAAGEKYQGYDKDHFDLIIMDECHRSYFGEWHRVLEYFSEGAILIGLTATPSSDETKNTDFYFTDEGFPPGPVFRYTHLQGEREGVLALTEYRKYLTNLDISGIHIKGYDFEPHELGRTVDVKERNELIAKTFFDLIEDRGDTNPPKTLVFAASIRHARNLKVAFIEEFNRRNGLRPIDAVAEQFIVLIHNEIPHVHEHIQRFQDPYDKDGFDLNAFIERYNKSTPANQPIIAVSIDMLSTGIDAPDIEYILMARPTRSKVLYTQMKGRGARITDTKDRFVLVDFVDTHRLGVITNEMIEAEERELERQFGTGEIPVPKKPKEGGEVKKHREGLKRKMVELEGIPVWIEYSEVIEPDNMKGALDDVAKQLTTAFNESKNRDVLIEKLRQAIISWNYLKGSEKMGETYLTAMGYPPSILRDIFGEDASLEEYVDVVMDEMSFEEIKARKKLDQFAEDNGLDEEQKEFVKVLSDFLRVKKDLSVADLVRMHILHEMGGIMKINNLFGDVDKALDLARLFLEGAK